MVFGDKLDADVAAALGATTSSGYLSGAALAARFPGADTAGQYWSARVSRASRRRRTALLPAGALHRPVRQRHHARLRPARPVRRSPAPIRWATRTRVDRSTSASWRRARSETSTATSRGPLRRPGPAGRDGGEGQGRAKATTSPASTTGRSIRHWRPSPAFFVTTDYDEAQARALARRRDRAASLLLRRDRHADGTSQLGRSIRRAPAASCASSTWPARPAREPGAGGVRVLRRRRATLVKKVQAEPGRRRPAALDRQRQDDPQQQGQAGQAVRALLQPARRRPPLRGAERGGRHAGALLRRGRAALSAPSCPTAAYSRVEFSPWHVTRTTRTTRCSNRATPGMRG